MLVYQSLVMILVIGAVFLLFFLLREKMRLLSWRLVLCGIIVTLVVGGSLLLSVIQSFFGVYFYNQNCDVTLYGKLALSAAQEKNPGAALKGYKKTTAANDGALVLYERTYAVQSGKVRSSIKVTYTLWKTSAAAEDAFRKKVTLFEDDSEKYKLFMPKYPDKSKIGKKNAPLPFEYVTTYTRSNYPNYNEILYVPSRLYYLSEVVIRDRNETIDLYETSNKNVTEKNRVMNEIAAMLAKTGK